ncbi:MAG: hypothetical protein K8T90_22485 [Planctomycetes bacterium]|nr:hypothetical protein [Planctomycetota bacterium]
MREQVERFGPWAIGAAFGWCVWAGTSYEPAEKPAARTRPPELPAACLVRRGGAEKFLTPRDPFQTDWAPYGAKFAPEYIAEQRQLKLDAERAATRRANEEAIERRKKAALVVAKRALVDVGFTLVLDAVARTPEGATARICGRTVRVGDPIPGLSGEPFPVLVRADGTSADVAGRGTTVTVTLDGRPVTMSPPPAVAPEAPVPAPLVMEADK